MHRRLVGFAVTLLAFGAPACRAAEPLVVEDVVLRPLVEAEAPARQRGVLATIAVQEGATVAAGDILASLDDRAARLAVQKAEVERDQAEAAAQNKLRVRYADKALEVARAELKRSSESIKEFARSISQSQIDVERLTVEKLQLERQQAEHDMAMAMFDLQLKENALEAARLELELHAVRAPFAGVAALVRARTGEWVEPGTPVLRLVAIDALRAEGFVEAGDIGAVEIGSAVQFVAAPSSSEPASDRDDGGDAVRGVLKYVSPEIDPVTRQVRVWAEIENRQQRLRPGQQGALQLQRTATK